MQEIDIYDFDRTLVPFDTGTKFAFYCCIHYPWCALFLLPVGIAALLGAAGIISWKGFKKFAFPLCRLFRATKL